MKRFNPLRLERLEDRTTPSGVTDPMQLAAPSVPDGSTPVQVSPTLPVAPDLGATVSGPALATGDTPIVPVDQLFVSNGGSPVSFGVGLGLIGPNGPLNPLPPTSGPTALLPVILPIPRAFGNLYPPAPPTMPAPPTSANPIDTVPATP